MALVTTVNTVATEISAAPYGSHRNSEPTNGTVNRTDAKYTVSQRLLGSSSRLRAGSTVLCRGKARRGFCSGAAMIQEASRFVPFLFKPSYQPWQFQPGSFGAANI
jgi:hypothetical protein